MLMKVSRQLFRCDHGDGVLSSESLYLLEVLQGEVEAARAVNVTSPTGRVGVGGAGGPGPASWRPRDPRCCCCWRSWEPCGQVSAVGRLRPRAVAPGVWGWETGHGASEQRLETTPPSSEGTPLKTCWLPQKHKAAFLETALKIDGGLSKGQKAEDARRPGGFFSDSM